MKARPQGRQTKAQDSNLDVVNRVKPIGPSIWAGIAGYTSHFLSWSSIAEAEPADNMRCHQSYERVHIAMDIATCYNYSELTSKFMVVIYK